MDRWTLDMSRLTKQRERAAAMQRAALIMAQRASIMCAMAEQRTSIPSRFAARQHARWSSGSAGNNFALQESGDSPFASANARPRLRIHMRRTADNGGRRG